MRRWPSVCVGWVVALLLLGAPQVRADVYVDFFRAVNVDNVSGVRSALQRGIESGEFRSMNVESCIDVIIAPLLMLVIWRHSFCFCGNDIDPQTYLTTHFDLLLNGLKASESKR